jgi:hypothetical protein
MIAMVGVNVGTASASPSPNTGAVSTTDNPGWQGPGSYVNQACFNGVPGHTTPAVNCNIYGDKRDVWLSGLPQTASLAAGTYFFAVLSPGGQASPNDCETNQSNDGNANLSDIAPCFSSGTGAGDSYTNRIFTVDSNGVFSYSGTHEFDSTNNEIQLFPYDDTPNPGGEYTMAVCQLPAHPTTDPITGLTPRVKASDCKYDNFKVIVGGGGRPPASALTITKDANGAYNDTYLWSVKKSADQTKIYQAAGGTAHVNYTVEVSHGVSQISDVTVTGTISVFNGNVDDSFNTVPVTADSVKDQLSNGTVCDVTGGAGPNIVLTTFETDFAYTCDLGSTLPSSSIDNTATVNWSDQTLSTGDPLTGGTANFTFSGVQFTGTEIDTCVDVTDTNVTGSLGTVCVTDPNPTDLTYSLDLPGVAGTCTDYPNTATVTTNDTGATATDDATVTVCDASDLTVSKVVTPGYTRTYKWSITKNVDKSSQNIAPDGTATFNYTVDVSHDAGTDTAFSATGTISVHNPNDFESITADVTDSIDNGGVCTVTNGTGVVIAAGATVQRSYSCTFGSNPGAGTNTGTATWDKTAAHTPSASASGTADYTFGNPTTLVDDTVTVSDSLYGTLGTVSVGTDPNPKEFTYQLQFKGDPPGTCTNHNNTATFTTNTNGATGSAGQTVTVCVGADLVVTKVATPSFDRKYKWTIGKSVDKTIVKQIGGSATFNYTVTVSHDSGTDGNWQVNGTISVKNPNDWEPITANISDAIDNGGTCTVTNGTGVAIAAGATVTRNYSCTYTSAPSPAAFTNTGKASWDATAASTKDSSATGTATGNFGTTTPNLIDECITVTDTYAGTLGTICVGGANPKAYTYSRTIPIPANGCLTYNNTAKFTTNDTGATGSADKSVQVCGPAATGALTIGFWKNNNGQGLIGTYCGSGTTGLAAYLKGLGAGSGPFSDAPQTTCSALATYVQNVLSGANASNMNVMLRAQMMGTALDVYFSGPGWTSTTKNGVKPPSQFLSHNTLGGFNMDMTAICPMVDNTTAGSASCTAGKPSTNAFASGAVPFAAMTIQQVLDFASTTPSPYSGLPTNVWYGGNKTLEEVLKNIYDQFNNQDAFSA